MKRTLTACLCLALLSVAGAQERSDFQIVKGFEKQYKEILKRAREVQNVQECAEVSVMLDELVKEYEAEKDLLNKALYGEKYEERVELARVQLKRNQDKLGIIESSVARIAELETKVRELSGQVSQLNDENSKLMGDVARLGANIKEMARGAAIEANMTAAMIDSLKRMVVKLQGTLRDRDKLIFAMVDSLFMQYDKNVSSLNNVEKSGLLAKVERNNIFSNVRKSIADNLQFLSATQLNGNDLANMVKEQKKFAAQWKAFGPKLASLYISGKNKKSELTEIDTMMAEWDTKVNSAFWRQINQELVRNGVVMSPVFSGERFADEFSSYLEHQSRIEDSRERSAKFDSFTKNVWQGEIGKTWIPLLVDDSLITTDQKTKIDEQYDRWRSSVSGPSVFVYILIALVLAAIVWGVMTRMKGPALKK